MLNNTEVVVYISRVAEGRTCSDILCCEPVVFCYFVIAIFVENKSMAWFIYISYIYSLTL